ncbi:unnamed protein product [Dovyalis caffra]|uniref:Ribosomal protein L37 n=1 Tax=Dovyalis caffra TaxID=77055 RepID=A0AAV1SRP1_9ROSI|nr:unnamed protein product [Dovyalis caffra]
MGPEIEWVREQGVLVRGGTRPTPSALGVGAVAFTSRRAVAPPVLSPLPARGNYGCATPSSVNSSKDSIRCLLLAPSKDSSPLACLLIGVGYSWMIYVYKVPVYEYLDNCDLRPFSFLIYNWSEKAIRRKTTGTGRMRYLRNVPRRFKSGFREGTQAEPRKKGAAASA